MFIMMFIIVSSSLLATTYLENLTEEERQQVKDFSISVDQDITETNFEELEGIEYTIEVRTPRYIIIKIKGYYYIIDTTS